MESDMSWEMLMEEAARNSAWLNERFNLDMNGIAPSTDHTQTVDNWPEVEANINRLWNKAMGYDQEPQIEEVTAEPVDENVVAAKEAKLAKVQYAEQMAKQATKMLEVISVESQADAGVAEAGSEA